MTGQSQDILNEKINKLKEIIPEVFTENKIDFEKLKLALGENINLQNERYVLNWAGKSDSFKVLQMPSTATLAPSPDESIDFDKTGNVFIEGENLEVLKILQKSYHGKIKMIYIDPPYNTGNDSFIYPDKFSETKEEYLKRIQEKDSDGYYTKEGLFRKNSSENGQFHSNWLSMIYPRLYLARSLLRDDGVIFVSIDDNEVHNLRMAMNEIFGEENFINLFTLKSNPRGSQASNFIALEHEYLIMFTKDINNLENNIGYEKGIEDSKDYNLIDENGKKYRLLGLRQRGGAWRREQRPKMFYPIYINPNNGEVSLEKNDLFSIESFPRRPSGEDSRWTWGKDLFNKNKNKLIGKKVNRVNEVEFWDIFRKDYLEDEDGNISMKKVKSIWDEKGINYQNGRNDIKNLFNNSELFDFPKPSFLIKKIISMFDMEDFIILDFFAGSGTTAHAVLELNKEDGGNRKFICVQLPEKTDENSEAYKAGYKTIADISKERIRRVIKKIEKKQEEARGFNPLFPDSDSENQIDLGFKVLKLKQSNFKLWRGDVIDNNEELEKQLEMFIDPVKEGAKEDNICYELLIKSGYELTVPIDKTNDYYIINNGEMIIAVNKIDDIIVKDIISKNPGKCIILDSLFNSNDQLKTNTVLQMKNAGIDFRSV